MNKFGVREICDVVLKAKSAQKIGNKVFYKNEPVIYFDTLKTSSMEGAATTVYAQGGRGNSRLVAWEGERTVTFTMEDALISPEGFMILSGAGLIDATESKPIYQHITETIDAADVDGALDSGLIIPVSHEPYLPGNKAGNFAYVMLVKDGEIISEPYIPVHGASDDSGITTFADEDSETTKEFKLVVMSHEMNENQTKFEEDNKKLVHSDQYSVKDGYVKGVDFDSVIVDYYTPRKSGAQQIEITADKFGGNYYLEASTLFRNQNGVDMPAEFIIPNCKVQSNFTFTMASSGDPSTFTFTMDAFPDYTRFDHSKKVLAAIQIIEEGGASDIHRHSTVHEKVHEDFFV